MITPTRRPDAAPAQLSASPQEPTGAGSELPPELPSVLDELTSAWERGQEPRLEMYLERLGPGDRDGALELIYRHFCLVEAAGGDPDPLAYQARFPQYKESLERLFRLHAECPPSLLDCWVDANSHPVELPEVGDSIGPYSLRRELGRGTFARVYLANQTDLEDRLVVLKVSTRSTREPWLLARLRHPHIVEILSHATVDDGALQLICMPFWGGATLAALLTARQARQTRPISGQDLLADLDSVAAPEYPLDNPSRPIRQILANMTYGQAVTWIVARLAEALDHAFQRGVAHGDVKPSNVLLSADGNPMLLDFNLARDWAAVGPDPVLADPGGTPAYMAPERLRHLAQADRSSNDARFAHPRAEPHFRCPGHVSPDEKGTATPADPGPHLADIYSLGIVLIEALSGRPAAPAEMVGDRTAARRFASSRSAEVAFAPARSPSPETFIRAALTGAGHPNSSGLRSILERCLDPNPRGRYRRAWELAQDLDRWRTDNPLAFAPEPFWAQALPRWLRRRRRLLASVGTAAVLAIWAIGLATWWSSGVVQQLSLYKYERYLDDPADYRFRRPNAAARSDTAFPSEPNLAQEPNDPRAITTAIRALQDYGVSNSREWRLRDDVRLLPAADRDDLKVWLMEQAYRYSRALIDQTSSHADWDRALMILDHAGGSLSTPAFAALRCRLETKLGSQTSVPVGDPPDSVPPTSEPATASPWLDEYLLGVAAEYRLDPEAAAAEALDHYETMLNLRPASYWGNYRAAAMCYRLGRNNEAASHLRDCLKRRPQNAMLRGQLAACLTFLNQFDEALRECQAAVETSPYLAFLFQNCAFIRALSKKTEGIGEDIEHFELLSQSLPRAFWEQPSFMLGDPRDRRALPVLDLPGSPGFGSGHTGRLTELEIGPVVVGINADELNARSTIALKIREAGDVELATAEFTKVLLFDPDHIAARMQRALMAVESGRFDAAASDINCVLAHPGLNAYLAERPDFITGLYSAAQEYLNHGKIDDCISLARRALDLAIKAKLARGPCHYILARAYAMSSPSNAQLIDDAAKQLQNALFAKSDYYRPLYESDTAFDLVRMRIDLYLALKSDSSASTQVAHGKKSDCPTPPGQ
ncbi:MAG: protein kinase domain-containing protein [Isosphaeraceae bacterium]